MGIWNFFVFWKLSSAWIVTTPWKLFFKESIYTVISNTTSFIKGNSLLIWNISFQFWKYIVIYYLLEIFNWGFQLGSKLFFSELRSTSTHFPSGPGRTRRKGYHPRRTSGEVGRCCSPGAPWPVRRSGSHSRPGPPAWSKAVPAARPQNQNKGENISKLPQLKKLSTEVGGGRGKGARAPGGRSPTPL